MGKRPLLIVALCVVAVIGMLAATAAVLLRSPPTVRLADGSVAWLEAVTYGKTHRLIYAPGWRRLLVRLLPTSMAARAGATVIPYRPRSKDACIVVWIARRMPGGSRRALNTDAAVFIRDPAGGTRTY